MCVVIVVACSGMSCGVLVGGGGCVGCGIGGPEEAKKVWPSIRQADHGDGRLPGQT